MLHLKKRHKLHLPKITHHKMVLSPVLIDDDSETDELLTSIKNDPITHDDRWTLDNADGGQLEDFWQGVEDDLKKDPLWYSFDDEE